MNTLESLIWQNQRCFILGGGPSLTGFDFNTIKDENTIGINKAFTVFPDTKINYSMDLKFYKEIQARKTEEDKKLYNSWTDYKGIKVFLKTSNNFVFDKDIIVLNKLSQKAISFDVSKGVYAGSNSGFGALMLSISLGCKQIFCLGYDFNVDTVNKKTHFHSGYRGQTVENFSRKLERFRGNFEEFASNLKDNNIDIVNLNPNSALRCFRFDTIENVMLPILV